MKEIKWVIGINLLVLFGISAWIFFEAEAVNAEFLMYQIRMFLYILLQIGCCFILGIIYFIGEPSKKLSNAYFLEALVVAIVGFSICMVSREYMEPIQREMFEELDSIEMKP